MNTLRPFNFLIKNRLRGRVHTLSYDHGTEIQKAREGLISPGALAVEPAGLLKAQQLLNAHQLFDEGSDWDVVSATAMIGHSARHNRHEEAINLFSRMLLLNIKPNEFTFGTVIHSSTLLGDLNLGKQFHAFAMKIGLESNVFVGSAMLDFYSKLGNIEEAQSAFNDTHKPNVVSYTTLIHGYLMNERPDDALMLFRTMPDKNVVSWNAMIGGYSQTGHNEEAVNLFVDMMREGLLPNESTLPSVISAAANIASLGIGKSFHACAIKSFDELDLFVGNSLVSFYTRCGSMGDGLMVFIRLPRRNIVSWNALIWGYARNGEGSKAIEYYQKLQSTGLQPNSVTLLGLLWACNHIGLVDEGYSYFNQARQENPGMLKPEHYACMVDLLSRSGRFMEAEKFICGLPFEPGVGFWKALLGGCQIHSNFQLGAVAARKILALEPEDVSSYVMLSNAHSAAGKWQNVLMMRKEMMEKGMERIPGCSWIEIKSKIHVFVRGNVKHDQEEDIHMVLKMFNKHAKEPQG